MNIFYINNIDISKPNGPGVNEREFVLSLQSHANENEYKCFFFMQNPCKEIDFTVKNCEFFKYKRGFQYFIIFTILILLIKRKRWLKSSDLIVLRINNNLLLLPLFFQLIKKRYYIKTLGNIYNFQYSSKNLFKTMLLKIKRRIIGRVLKKAIAIDVCTPQYKNNYENKYRLENIDVIENAVNIDKFQILGRHQSRTQCSLESYSKIIGYCGGSPSIRGATQLIEISPRLIAKYPKCGILIIGEDSNIPLLKKRADELNVTQNIIFKGRINYQNLPPFINCLDVGIGFDSSIRIKTIGNSSQKIKQYLACGVPVVCAKNTNHDIVNNDLGIAVSQDDLNAIFDSVCYWLDKSSEEIEKFSQTARNYVEEHLSTAITFNTRYKLWHKLLSNNVTESKSYLT